MNEDLKWDRVPHSSQSGVGFTLIEALIVIAIIGILAGLVLTGIISSRDKAYDTRIRNGVGQIRWLAENVYNGQGNTYVDWTQQADIQTSLTLLLEDIDKNYGDAPGAPYVTVMRETQDVEYCVSAPLKSDPGKYYCVDATAAFRTVSSPCPDIPYGGVPIRCPSL